MRTIRVSPLMQVALLVSFLGAVAAAVASQMPEIQRYLKVKQM